MNTEKPTRKPRGFKIALIILAVLFLLFVCTLYFLPHFLPIGTIKNIANTKARELAGLNVDFENMRFAWNGDIVLDNIVVSPLNDDGTPGDPLVTVDTARTNVQLTPLLSGKAIVNSVEVDGFSLKVKREADGSLNLPDFSNLSARTPFSRGENVRDRMLLSAKAAEPGVSETGVLPPIELHQLDLKNGIVGFEDVGENMAVDIGVDFVTIKGKTLDDPFTLSGRLLPYPGSPELGEIPFTGRIAMLSGGQLDLDGEANFEANVKAFSLNELADKLNMGHFLPSGRIDGIIRAVYNERKGAVHIADMRVDHAVVGLGSDLLLEIPDTIASLEAVYDPAPGIIDLNSMSIANEIASLTAAGRIDGVDGLTHGGTPEVEIRFSGSADFATASQFLVSQNLLEGELPELDGSAEFAGTANLPAQEAGGILSPKLELRFTGGSALVRDGESGIAAGLEFSGIALDATARLGERPDVASRIQFSQVPARLVMPQIVDQAVTASLNGTASLVTSPSPTAEFRFRDSSADLPATAWTSAAAVRQAEAQIIVDLDQDVVSLGTIKAVINESIEGGVQSGRITGALSGAPNGEVDLALSALLEKIKELVEPVFPGELMPEIAGQLRAATKVRIDGGAAEILVSSEVDNMQAVFIPRPGVDKADISVPKATLAVRAGLDLTTSDIVTVHALNAASGGAAVSFADRAGSTAAGQIGNALINGAGTVNLSSMQAALSNLSVDVGGVNIALGKGGQQVGSLVSGLMKVVAATPDTQLSAPLSGEGDFNIPSLELGIDNLVFQFRERPSNLGSVRAKLGADGYIGPDKRQLINLRTASLAATPLAVNSRGQIDLGSGALLAEYAANVAPAGMASLLEYLDLPPSLLAGAQVRGTVALDDNQVASKGEAVGQLQTGDNGVNPFEFAHDLSLGMDPETRVITFDIRRLGGAIKTANGDAVATMAAQPSKLILSRGGSEGLLDIRVNGSAGSTRMLLAGLVGMVPLFDDYTRMLYNARADGIYNAGVQIRSKEESTLGVRMVGEWEGAALSFNGVPYLAEARKLSAGLEGEYAFNQNQVRLTNFVMFSESAGIQAQGAANVTLSDNQEDLENLTVAIRFTLADLARAAMVFPGIIPGDLALAGKVDGVFRAGGDARDIRVEEGAVNFQGFRAVPAAGIELTIPNGAARLAAGLSVLNTPDTGSAWDVFRMVNISGGNASLTGAVLNGNAIDQMGASFQLENGVLDLQSAQLSVGGGSGGSAAANARVNFNTAFPQIAAQWAVQNLPIPDSGGSGDSLTMEGEFSFQDNQAQLPHFRVRTASGLVHAEGTGAAVLSADQDNLPNGIANLNLDMRFGVADIARLAQTLPGIIPNDLGLSGSIDGTLQAAGAGQDIRVNQCIVNFNGFRAAPSPDLALIIPSGSATIGGTLAAHMNAVSTGSAFDILRMIDIRDGQASVNGAILRDKAINEMTAAFHLQGGVLTLNSARVTIGEGSGGSVLANATVDFNRESPAVNARVALRNIPLSEVNSEISELMTVRSGVLNIPANQGGSAGVSFSGLSTDEILQTLRLENFNFATGPVVINTGPKLNAELDKARALLKMQSNNGVREITFSSITGTAVAHGDGAIRFPAESPITLVGNNTADFQARGIVYSNHTLDMKVMVAGKLDNIIGFGSLPNLIPNLSGNDDSSRLMDRMNASAAKGNYSVHVKGSLSDPDITGIGALAAQFLKDLLLSSPTQIIGGVLDLGKDTPGALLNLGGNVVEGVLNPADTVKNAPKDVVKGLGQIFGVTRGKSDEKEKDDDDDSKSGRRLPFGIR